MLGMDREALRLVKDLHAPRPSIYWTDLVLTTGLGWIAFGAAMTWKPFRWPMLAAALIASLALYRGLCFLHEITHLRPSALRGFETAWNILIGVPLLIPSFMYVGVHQDHHKISIYGTGQDPEYLPLSGRRLRIALITLESFLIPLLLMMRFVLVAPVSLVSRRVHQWLAVHASALCINPEYRREFSEALSRKIARWETVMLCFWYGLVALAAFRILPWRFLAIWYSVSAAAAIINMVRTLGAHHYENDGKPLDRDGQLSDSVDTPGAFWTELWAPVGLRYHALHHYFPGIPYHNLGKAYERLIQTLPPDSLYRQATSPGLAHSLRALYQGPAGTAPISDMQENHS